MVQLHCIVSRLSIIQLFNQVFGIKFFKFFHLHSLSIFIVITTYYKLCFNRQFLCTESESLLSDVKRNALYFKEDAARGNRSHPSCGVTFTFTHTHIRRLTCYRFVREDADPYLSLTIHIAVYCHTGSLYLSAINPFWFKSLDTERTESQLCTAVCVAFIATTILRSSIFYSFWL